MTLFKSRKISSRPTPPMRDLSKADLAAVSGGTPGQMNPIHAPSPRPIVFQPIITPFPFRRLPG